ncbi:MAG TPA: oligoribonuclease [Deltaproteobacteria bacterium]|nr:oligoribonuclease [Deltaproteobacteria bacterium]HCP44683.1 oligoribonuclease [Deltaproteobacteria bacterium]
MMLDPSNLVWVDLEMTGLEPDDHLIIEVAILVTDAHLRVLEEGPCVAIHQSDETLARMDDWCTRTHTASGLVKRIRESDVTIEQAEAKALEFVSKWVPPGRSPLCGNSISHDRRFLRRYMPRFEEHLHYRHIDVSTIKELVSRWYPRDLRPPTKKGHHLALDDIRESVEELRWYREHVFVHPPQTPSGAEGDDSVN